MYNKDSFQVDKIIVVKDIDLGNFLCYSDVIKIQEPEELKYIYDT